jgi:CubicO group peptidase (beta-lactamase class C family)
MQGHQRTRLAVLAVLLVVALVPARGQQQHPSVLTPAGTLPALESYLEALRQQSGIPGMSAAVVREGVIIWEKGYGFQDVAARLRATPDTPYLVGDMSETLAAVLLLQCVEQRRLTLDEPFQRHEIAGVDSSATLRQILGHTPPEPTSVPFAYNPDRYAQLTAAMEWCAPQPYRKSIAHRLLNRLAMKDSVPGTDLQAPDFILQEGLFEAKEVDDYRRVLARLAVPYKVDGKGRAERNDLPGVPITSTGGLVSTVRDLARFDSAIDSVEAPLLTEETLAVAWSPAAERSGLTSPMGLGWFVQTYKGERLVWHFGYVQNGYSSLILKVPARKLTFILLANGDGLSAPFQLQAGDVTRSLFATLFLRLAL